LKHTTRTVRAIMDDLRYSIDVNTLHRHLDATQLNMNEVGRVHLRTSEPLFVDEYRTNRDTGSFILIDEMTYDTVGAGMVASPAQGGWLSADGLGEFVGKVDGDLTDPAA
jgi:bifunctional enzyme CysN/CysC